MKKINIFNKTISPLSSGKGCPVERGGVWELPRRTPCAPPSWKEGERKVPSFRGNAESPRCCRELVCGKTDGIPLFSGMTVRICGMIIVIAALFATPSFAEPTELDKKTVASKAYVDTKQDKITTGNVMFYDDPEGTEGDVYVPGLVAYDSQTNALSGNKIGILDQETILGDEGGLVVYSHVGGYGTEMDNFVPTVRAVAEALQGAMPNALDWDTNTINAINAYSTTFGNGENNWAGDSGDMITGQFLANSLTLKQNKLPAKSTGNAAPKGNQAVVLNTAGNPLDVYTTAGKDLALTAKSGAQKVMNYIDGTTASATFAPERL